MTVSSTSSPSCNRRHLNGILLLDKPAGITSNQVLQQVKRLFNAHKAGHGGTLDQPATGALPIMFGCYTKLSEYMLDSYKVYQAKINLGVTTTTADAKGEAIETKEVPVITDEIIENCLQQFRGNIMQTPPIYSALKYQGKRLYEYALAGKDVPIKQRPVEIRYLQLLERGNDYLVIKVECSRGTYIRSLADDIGKFLGCGAHIQTLRRLSLSSLPANYMIDLDKLEQTPDDMRDNLLVPDELIAVGTSKVFISSQQGLDLCNGKQVEMTDYAGDYEQLVSIYLQKTSEPSQLIGVGTITSGHLKHNKIFSTLLVAITDIATTHA